MATILPGSPPAFNKNDVSGTVKALCNYTRTLQENIDFMLGQLQKDLATTQGDLKGLQTTVGTMGNTLTGVQNSVTTLGSNYNSLAARVSALEQKVN